MSYIFEHCNNKAKKIREYQRDNNEIAWRGLVSELKFKCTEYQIDYNLFNINESFNATPQLTTVEIPQTAGLESELTQAEMPLPFISIINSSKCQNDKCQNLTENKYCSNTCYVRMKNKRQRDKLKIQNLKSA
jgi:hypothetical protein